MPTKRPDQLPEGEDFDFEDILMVEKFPNSESRKLYKAKLRNFIESALKMDPERIGSNALLGLQSKFDWLIDQMDTLAEANAFNIEKYSDYDSNVKREESKYIIPTPSVTPSFTPTPSPTLPQIIPSTTPTPTPSSTPAADQVFITINGSTPPVFDLPPNYLPKLKGYNDWFILDDSSTENISPYFRGNKPFSFTPSSAGEYLSLFSKGTEGDTIIARTHIIRNEGDEDLEEVINLGGLQSNSSITFKIKYI